MSPVRESCSHRRFDPLKSTSRENCLLSPAKRVRLSLKSLPSESPTCIPVLGLKKYLCCETMLAPWNIAGCCKEEAKPRKCKEKAQITMAGLSKTLKRRATKRDTADTNVTAQDLREKKKWNRKILSCFLVLEWTCLPVTDHYIVYILNQISCSYFINFDKLTSDKPVVFKPPRRVMRVASGSPRCEL